LGRLPGAAQRRRTLAVVVVAMLVFLLRPLPPLAALPGWVVGGLLFWATLELLGWLWRPRRWS
jgi:hypothetical protein